MNCNEVKELLSLYMDNMLEPDQMDAISEHLMNCDTCRQEHQEMTQMLSLLSDIEDVPLPEEFECKLHLALQKEAESIRNSKVKSIPSPKKRWKGWTRFTSIAAVFVVGLFSILLYNNLDGLNMGNLGDYYNAEKGSDQVIEDSSKSDKNISNAPISAKKENSDTNADSDVSYGFKAQLENSQVASSANNSDANTQTGDSESTAANQAHIDDSQIMLKSATLTQEDDSKGTGSPPSVSSAPESKRSYTCTDEFNPSRFLETLNEEDAQIYKELLSANIFLSSGRDSNAVIYYIKQLKKALGETEYTLVNCYQEPEGLWNIQISITTTDENGNEVKEDVTYCGKDGELWKKELSSSTETV